MKKYCIKVQVFSCNLVFNYVLPKFKFKGLFIKQRKYKEA